MLTTLQNFPFFSPGLAQQKPLVAISACLAGHKVRYDGASKTLDSTLSFLAKQLHLLAICPEADAGLGIPRAPIQLQLHDQKVLAIGRDDPALNVTIKLESFAQHTLNQHGEHLHGYIFKSRSPSCGVGSTPLYDPQGRLIHLGSGIQSAAIQQHLPWLPVQEEGQLNSEQQCEHFVWQCRLMMDVHLAISQHQLGAWHSHFRPLLQQLPTASQQGLASALETSDERQYRTELNRAISTWIGKTEQD